MKKQVVKGLILGVLLWSLMGSPVFAISNPDSISIGDIYVFQDVLETGDILVFMRYDVDYTSQPSEDADGTFLMAIYDTDGTTLLFTRPVNYYQHNIISIYLDAGDNTLNWGSLYYIRIMGSSALFDPLVEGTNMRTQVLSSGEYRDTDALGGIMIAQAAILETDWSTTLLTASDRLNTTGANYFLKAVPGLSTMVPGIFELATEEFIYAPNTAYAQTGLNATKENVPVSLNNAITGLNAMFGITNPEWGSFGWSLLVGLMVGAGFYGAARRPDIAILGGVVGTLGLQSYLGYNENILFLLMAVGTVIIVLFAILFVLPRLG